MDFPLIHPLADFKKTFVYRNGARRAMPGAVDEDEETEDRQAEQQERLAASAHRQELQSDIARAQVSPETRAMMRAALASDSTERQDAVERFLKRTGERQSEAQLREALGSLEQEDASWSVIFNAQREVRKKIQELRYRAESYPELVPTQKSKFEIMLASIKSVNSDDDASDRSLKRALSGITIGHTTPPSPGAALDPEEAREIYLVSPLQDGYESTMKKYKRKIEAAPGGSAAYRRITTIKSEEAKIERRYRKIHDEFQKTIEVNLSKARRKVERDHYLEMASKVVGITLKEGVTIEFSDPDILDIEGNTVKIQRVEWKSYTVHDSKGRPINRYDAIPTIHLSNGAVMPLGRFKKWVDAGDGVEKIGSIDEVNRAAGLAAYGLKLQKGMELSYTHRTVDSQGKPTKHTSQFTIADIRDGKIYFDSPVPYQPGYQNLNDYDMRDSLTFGQFVKWWHRYEIERSISLQELQTLLVQFNTIENKTFGLEPKDNPPILVVDGEELRYPDEIGDIFKIEHVAADGVLFDDGEKRSFPEFFYWVKNNHVEKVPEKFKTPEERAAKAKQEEDKLREEMNADAMKELKIQKGRDYSKGVEEYKKNREASTPWGTVKKMWWQTHLLSFKDVWNLSKEIFEFVKRRHERRSKDRYGTVGASLPGLLGTEFERVRQSAETEEVNKYKEAMEHWGIPEVQRALHLTNNKDVAKGCIMTLVNKGEMRWDDHKFWKTLNRLTSRYTLRGAELYIPDPEHMPKLESGEDKTMPAMDALWGAGTGAEWLGGNTSKYNSNKNNFEYKFKQLENDPKGTGGPTGECARLLKEWRKGNYVNPQEYEEMIDAAIKYGKMTAEGKFFFIIAGVLAHKGDKPHEETLLHYDRIGELNSKYLNQFPMLDFFTQEYVFDETIFDKKEGTWGKSRKLQLSDLEKWKNEYFPDDFRDGMPDKQFSRFMWEKMMMSDATRTRISKGIRNAENMDHDDAHIIISAVTPSEIDSITTGPSGQKKYFTNEGYMNGYPGFNHLILSLSHAIEEEEDKPATKESEDSRRYKMDALRDAINAFVRYDAILDNRLFREKGSQHARLDQRHYSRASVIDKSQGHAGFVLRDHQAQMRNLVVEIGAAYNEDWSWLYQDKFGIDPDGMKKQVEYERKVNELREILSGHIEKDKGKKAMEAITRIRERDPLSKSGLCGIFQARRPSREKLQQLRERAQHAEIEKLAGGGGEHH